MNIKSKKIAILGAGKSGISAAKLASHLGAKILISDTRLDLNEINIKIFRQCYLIFRFQKIKNTVNT